MTVLKPSFESFSSLADHGNLIPVWTELAADYETPVSAFQKLSEGIESPCFLLESAENSEQIGRFSFLGTNPRIEIRAHVATILTRFQNSQEFQESTVPEGKDPLHEVERIMSAFRPVEVEGVPIFAGGAVGFLGYDMVRFFEPTVPGPKDEGLGLPDMAFLITETLVIFDHRFRKLQVVANVCTDDFSSLSEAYEHAGKQIEEIISHLAKPQATAPFSLMEEPAEAEEVVSNTSREEFESMVKRAKEYILEGDIFQVVPSQRFESEYRGRPIDLYRALRHVNPSPYMFCLEFGDEFSLVGSSPEVHVQTIDGKIKIRPIAGTRWRGSTPEEDDALADELLNDPKERAEHVMLIDLARNDVGRVAEFESVEVSEFMIIERYSHVMHIVSNVIGSLRPGQNAYDVMRATFPAGTVSGSPKVRAMQIIEELEKSKRGAYAGAVGYFGFDGNHDSCIALRTVVLKDGKAFVQAGAGVVADSVPANEYVETVNKAKGMMRAIERAKLLG
ncbi:MAG: anthranilate synthase component I [Verrucomicrobiota bacterium]